MTSGPGAAPALGTGFRAAGPAVILGFSAAAAAIFAVALTTPYAADLVFYCLALLVAVILRPHPLSATVFLTLLALALRQVAGHCVSTIIVFDDEVGYARMASEVVDALRYGYATTWDQNPWSNVTAVVFQVFGESRQTIKAMNAFLSILAAFTAFRAALRIWPEDARIAEWALRLLLFLPAFLVLSSVALKEQLLGTLLVLLLSGAATRSWSGTGLALASLGGLWLFRSSLAAVITMVWGLYLVSLIFKSGKVSGSIKTGVACVLVATFLGAGMVLLKTSFGSRLKIVLILSGKDKRGLKTMAENTARFADHLDVENPFAPRNLVLAPLRSLFSPSPLRPLKSPGPPVYLEAVAMTGFLYFALPFVILAIVGAGSHPERWLAGGLFLSVFITASLSILSFAPETFRYRWPDFPIYFMLAVAGWFAPPSRWRNPVIWGWWLTAGAFSAVYLL